MKLAPSAISWALNRHKVIIEELAYCHADDVVTLRSKPDIIHWQMTRSWNDGRVRPIIWIDDQYAIDNPSLIALNDCARQTGTADANDYTIGYGWLDAQSFGGNQGFLSFRISTQLASLPPSISNLSERRTAPHTYRAGLYLSQLL